ncbi:hypothetical protein IT575_12015 [bacterium]|nr:hypothetical protein [bacterium]
MSHPFVADYQCHETFAAYRNQQLGEFFARLDIGDESSAFLILNAWVELYEANRQLAYGPWRLTWAYGYATMCCTAAQLYLYSGDTGSALNCLDHAMVWLGRQDTDEARGLSKGWNDVRCALLSASGLLLMVHPELASASPLKLAQFPALQRRCLDALKAISSAATRKSYRETLDQALGLSVSAQLLHGKVKDYEKLRQRLIKRVGEPYPEQPAESGRASQREVYWLLAQVLEVVGSRKSRARFLEFAELEKDQIRRANSENPAAELERADTRTKALAQLLGERPRFQVIGEQRVS